MLAHALMAPGVGGRVRGLAARVRSCSAARRSVAFVESRPERGSSIRTSPQPPADRASSSVATYASGGRVDGWMSRPVDNADAHK